MHHLALFSGLALRQQTSNLQACCGDYRSFCSSSSSSSIRLFPLRLVGPALRLCLTKCCLFSRGLQVWARLLYERGQLSSHSLPAVTPDAAAVAAAAQDAAMAAGTADWPLPPWMQPTPEPAPPPAPAAAAATAGAAARGAAAPVRGSSAPPALKSVQGSKQQQGAAVKKGSSAGAAVGKKAPAVLVSRGGRLVWAWLVVAGFGMAAQANSTTHRTLHEMAVGLQQPQDRGGRHNKAIVKSSGSCCRHSRRA